MPADPREELLVTIAPLLSRAPEPEYRPWVGPLLIVGVPVVLAVAVFTVAFHVLH
jgi:hypothetical protein